MISSHLYLVLCHIEQYADNMYLGCIFTMGCWQRWTWPGRKKYKNNLYHVEMYKGCDIQITYVISRHTVLRVLYTICIMMTPTMVPSEQNGPRLEEMGLVELYNYIVHTYNHVISCFIFAWFCRYTMYGCVDKRSKTWILLGTVQPKTIQCKSIYGGFPKWRYQFIIQDMRSV